MHQNCPRDKQDLQAGTFHDIPALHCPECDGVLIKQASLHPLLTAMAKELGDAIHPECEVEAIVDDGQRLQCPSCASNMENYGYMGGRDVMIDCCGRCMELWIDAGELAVMCILNERANRRISLQREAAREHMKELERMTNLRDIVHGAYMRGFVMGAIVF